MEGWRGGRGGASAGREVAGAPRAGGGPLCRCKDGRVWPCGRRVQRPPLRDQLVLDDQSDLAESRHRAREHAEVHVLVRHRGPLHLLVLLDLGLVRLQRHG